jgi:hypothetical protein
LNEISGLDLQSGCIDGNGLLGGGADPEGSAVGGKVGAAGGGYGDLCDAILTGGREDFDAIHGAIGDEYMFGDCVVGDATTAGFAGWASRAATASVRMYVVRGREAIAPAWTVRASVSEWESAPLEPCAVIVKSPVVAFGDAPKTTAVGAEDATVKGLAGLEVTPVGRPARVTWTVLLKPFWLVREIVTGGLVAPCAKDGEEEEREIEKSAGGGGGGWMLAEAPPPPPHPADRALRKERVKERASL